MQKRFRLTRHLMHKENLIDRIPLFNIEFEARRKCPQKMTTTPVSDAASTYLEQKEIHRAALELSGAAHSRLGDALCGFFLLKICNHTFYTPSWSFK